MSTDGRQALRDIQVDQKNLYREETFTDLKVATIRRLSPVNPDGSKDKDRGVIFVGSTQVLTQAGPLPIECPLEAETLDEALAKFPEAINQVVEDLMAEARKIQIEQASRLVVPGQPLPGGKIQLS